jgi:epoxyqueuosine reductase
MNMTESDLIALTRQKLLEEGVRSRVVPLSRLEEIGTEIKDVMRGFTDPGLVKYIGAFLNLNFEEAVPGARSVVVMGISSPKVRFHLRHDGRDNEGIVPPTYLDYNKAKERIESVLSSTLGAHGYRYASLQIPVKLLAVRSGLAEYGRNNVTYVEGLGSYVRLMAYASNLPCEEHDWFGKRAMSRCSRCNACIQNCPTGAINKSRFLLKAERCLTFLNEEEAEIPKWVESSWHYCLIGCLRCQDVCPANKNVAGQFLEGAEFSEEETDILMKTSQRENLPAELKKKMDDSRLSLLYPVLPRNVALLLNRTR